MKKVYAFAGAALLLVASRGWALKPPSPYLPGFSVTYYGAKCDGSTDDTAAIQTGLNALANTGGILNFPSGTCNLSKCLIIPDGVSLQGQYTGVASSLGTNLNQTASTCTFQVGANEFQGSAIQGFEVSGGSVSLYAPDGVVNLRVENVRAYQPSYAGILLQGYIQQTFWKNIEMDGGAYCMNYSTNGVHYNGNSWRQEFDKNSFYDIYCNGSSLDGIVWAIQSNNSATGGGTGGQNSITNLIIIHAGHNGFVLKGPFLNTIINGWNTEGNGYSQSLSSWSVTQATATAGGKYVLVTSTVALTIGDTVTVQGAGSTGLDFQSYVTNIFTSSITVGANIVTTSSGVELTNALYSDFVLDTVTSGIPEWTTVMKIPRI